jgi:hypothetical protein
MTRVKYLAAAAVLSSLIASPVLARDLSQNMNAQNSNTTYQNATYRQSDRSYDRSDVRRHDSGFWPADVAAGVVGGAVGAAGAIATAPFRNDAYAYNDYNDAYAYDNGGRYYSNDGQREAMDGGPPRYSNPYSYAARNGFVCQPGTLVRLEDGQQHLCQ